MRSPHRHFIAVLLAAILSFAVVSAGLVSRSEISQVQHHQQLAPRGSHSCRHSYQCATKLDYCNKGKCEPKGLAGAACLSDIGCQSGKCSSKGVCKSKTQLATGSSCKSNSQCVSDLCHHSLCQDKTTLGGTCRSSHLCSSGKCSHNACVRSGKGLLRDGSFCLKSSKCKSGNCNKFYCARRKEDGKKCYKNNNCQSGHCNSKKLCGKSVKPANPSASPSASASSSSPSPTASSPAGTPLVSGGAFEDGKLGGFKATGEVTVGNNPAHAHSGDGYVQMGATAGNPAIIFQSLTTSSNSKIFRFRQDDGGGGTTFFADFWYEIFTFNDGSTNSNSNTACTVSSFLNNEAVSTETIDASSATLTYLESSGTVTLTDTPETFGIQLSCAPGASAIVFFDDIELIEEAPTDNSPSTSTPSPPGLPTPTSETPTSEPTSATPSPTNESFSPTPTPTPSEGPTSASPTPTIESPSVTPSPTDEPSSLTPSPTGEPTSASPSPTSDEPTSITPTPEPTPVGQGTYILSDGDFESGLGAWTGDNVDIDTSEPYSGSADAGLVYTDGSPGTLQQVLAVNASIGMSRRDEASNYTLTFWALLDDIAGDDDDTAQDRQCTLDVYIADQDGYRFTNISSTSVTDQFFVEEYGQLTFGPFSMPSTGAELVFSYTCNEYVTRSLIHIDDVVLQTSNGEVPTPSPTPTPSPSPTPAPSASPSPSPTLSPSLSPSPSPSTLPGNTFHVISDNQYLTFAPDAFRLTTDVNSAVEFVFQDSTVYIASGMYKGYVLFQFDAGDFIRARATSDSELRDNYYLQCHIGSGASFSCHPIGNTGTEVYSLYTGDDARAGLVLLGSTTWDGGASIPLTVQYLDGTIPTPSASPSVSPSPTPYPSESPYPTPSPSPPSISPSPSPSPSPTSSPYSGPQFYVTSNGQYLTTDSDAFRLTNDISQADQFVFDGTTVIVTSGSSQGDILFQFREGDYMRARPTSDGEMQASMYLSCQVGAGDAFSCFANGDTSNSVYSLYSSGDDSRDGLIVLGDVPWQGSSAIPLTVQYLVNPSSTPSASPSPTETPSPSGSPSPSQTPTTPSASPTPSPTASPSPSSSSPSSATPSPSVSPSPELPGQKFYITSNNQYMKTDDGDAFRLTDSIDSATKFIIDGTSVYIAAGSFEGNILYQYDAGDFIRQSQASSVTTAQQLVCTIGSDTSFSCYANNDPAETLYSLYTDNDPDSPGDSRVGLIVLGEHTWANGPSIPLNVQFL